MKNNKLKLCLKLLLTFMKIGVVTFGGGYAMIPFIETEVVEKNKWLTKEELIDVVAISESTPGPIGICCATFVGYNTCGLLGAFFATLGAIIPSFVIIYVISLLFEFVKEIVIIKYMFFGIRAGVLALLFRSIFTMYKASPKHIVSYIIMAISFVLVIFFSCNVIFILLGAAIVGLLTTLIIAKGGNKK